MMGRKLLLFSIFFLIMVASVHAQTALTIAPWYPQGASYVFICDEDNNATSYDWYFGDGKKLLGITNRDVYHYFYDDGLFTVSCTARGATDETSTLDVTVRSNTPPQDVNITYEVNLSIHPWFPKGNDYIFFCDADYAADEYSWNFGDGSRLNYVQNNGVFHTFPDDEQYTVTCTAHLFTIHESASMSIGTPGNTAIPSDNQTNTTSPEPTTHLAAVTVLEPFPIHHNYAFDCQVADFTPETYEWRFSDGTTATRSVPDIYHSYNSTGSHNATCIARNGAQTAHGTIAVTVQSPDVTAGRTTLLSAEEMGDGKYQLTCEAVGYIMEDAAFYNINATDVFYDGGLSYAREDLHGPSTVIKLNPNGQYEITCSPYLHDSRTHDTRQLPQYYDEGPTYHNMYCGNWGVADCYAPTSNTLIIDVPPFAIDTAGQLDATIVVEREQDMNRVLRCEVAGLYPTSYAWEFGDDSTANIPVPDVFHTYPGNGTYTTTCTASDGTTNVSGTTTLDITTPYDLGGSWYGVRLAAVQTGEFTWNLTCNTVGFEANTAPYDLNWFPGSVALSEINGEHAVATVPGPGTYDVGCSAGVGYRDFPAYYGADPYAYHNEDVVCSNGGCTGEGNAVTLIA